MPPSSASTSAADAKPAGNGGGVQSLERAFDLLERMADAGGEVGLSELSATSGLPLPTIHRLMRTLVACGYVRQQPNRRYALGPRLIRLGESASRLLGTWARPFLARLVEETGETANMALLDGDEIVYVAQVPSRHAVRMFTEVGRRVLPHSTGVGKALLADHPPEEVRALLGRTGMPAATEKTITDPDTLPRRALRGPPARLRRRRQRAGDRRPLLRGAGAQLPHLGGDLHLRSDRPRDGGRRRTRSCRCCRTSRRSCRWRSRTRRPPSSDGRTGARASVRPVRTPRIGHRPRGSSPKRSMPSRTSVSAGDSALDRADRPGDQQQRTAQPGHFRQPVTHHRVQCGQLVVGGHPIR